MAKSDEPNPVGEAFKKLSEHVSKQAGWLPLFACVTLAVEKFNVRVPTRYELFRIGDEWTIPFATFVLFLLGDALDKAVFKRRLQGEKVKLKNRWPARYFEAKQEDARKQLKLGHGSYSAAMGVVGASLTWPCRIVFTNELAKFLRSLVLPALVFLGYETCVAPNLGAPFAALIIGFIAACVFLALTDNGSAISLRFVLLLIATAAFATCAVTLLRAKAWWPLLFLVVSVASLFGYLVLKNWHILLVYKAAAKVKQDNEGGKYVVGTVNEVDREVRLIFWDGKLVGSAMAPETETETVKSNV